MEGTSTHYIVLKELAGNAPPTLNPIQQVMAPYVHEIIVFWLTVWCFVGLVLLLHLYQEYRKSRSSHSE